MTKHPLDPLGPDEIARAVEIIRKSGGLSRSAWFETIALHEPLKEHLGQGSCPRLAYVCCYDPDVGETWDGIVDLGQARLKDWRHVKGAQARIVIDEFIMGGEIAKADPRFIAACAKRGITDMNAALIEPGAAGRFVVRVGRDARRRARPGLAR